MTGKDRITATWLIDELNQYKLGNVTKLQLLISLAEATYDFKADNL